MAIEDPALPQKCLACNADLNIPVVCEGCHTLYPIPKTVDYFQLLGLERTYDIDVDDLNRRFVSVSRNIHPDFFVSAGSEMGGLATRLSAELNEAIAVLKDPVLRAGYLLETSGGPSAADDRTVPAEVLGDAMMLREEIEEAVASQDEAALCRLRDTVDAKRADLLDTIAGLARRLPGADDAARARLRHAINSIKYFSNMRNQLWAA